MRGLERLKVGDFNAMRQEGQPDGSVIITLSSRKYPEVYRFRVRDLYGPNEEELDVVTGEPIGKGDLQADVSKVPKKARGTSKG